jgi:hypothetical protein
VCTNEREQFALAFFALRADLCKPGRDHAHCPHACIESGLHGVEDGRRRDAHDCKVEGVGHLCDRAISSNAGDRLSVAVHGVRRALVVGVENVAKQLAADGPAARRSSDHGDRPRLEEGAQRSHHGGVVSLGDE